MHCDPHAADTRLSAPLARFECNSRLVIHLFVIVVGFLRKRQVRPRSRLALRDANV